MSHPALGQATKLLSALGKLSARTDAAERSILEAAKSRLASAHSEREKMRPRALLDPVADEHYQALTTEIGHLQQVIGRAQRNLVDSGSRS